MDDMEDINVQYLSKLQESSDPEVLTYSSQVLSYMMLDSKFRQLFKDSRICPLKSLVCLCSHEEIWIQQQALITLANLSFMKHMREPIVQSGTLSVLLEVLSKSKHNELHNIIVMVICNCKGYVDASSSSDLVALYTTLVEMLDRKNFEDVLPLIILGLDASIHHKHVREILFKYDLISTCFSSLRYLLDNVEKWYEEHLLYDPKNRHEWAKSPWMDASQYCEDACWFTPIEWYKLSSRCSLTYGWEPNSFKDCVLTEDDDSLTILDMKCRVTPLNDCENLDFRDIACAISDIDSLSEKDTKYIGLKYLSYLNTKYVYTIPIMSMGNYRALVKLTGLRLDKPIFRLIKKVLYYDKIILDIDRIQDVVFDYFKCIDDPSDILLNILSNITLKSIDSEDFNILSMFGLLPTMIEKYSLNIEEVKKCLNIDKLSKMLQNNSSFVQLNVIEAALILHKENENLHSIFWDGNGLGYLINILSENNIARRRRAMISVSEFYEVLTKKLEKENLDSQFSTRCDYEVKQYDITFLLDSGTKIGAVRHKICSKSEYFNMLLNGQFIESTATEISFPDVSDANMRCILHFLQGNGKLCHHVEQSVSFLLNLLVDCEKFLLKEMKKLVEEQLLNFEEVASPELLMYAKMCNSKVLIKRVIHFLLMMHPVDSSEFQELYQQLSDSCSDFFRLIEETVSDLSKKLFQT